MLVESLSETDQVKALEIEWRQYYKEGAFLHSRIALEPDADKRKEMAFRILYLFDDLCKPIWEKLQHFKNNGHLPKPPVVEAPEPIDLTKLSAIDLLKMRNNLRTYISKAKAGKKPAENIPDWEKQLTEVTNLLANA